MRLWLDFIPDTHDATYSAAVASVVFDAYGELPDPALAGLTHLQMCASFVRENEWKIE